MRVLWEPSINAIEFIVNMNREMSFIFMGEGQNISKKTLDSYNILDDENRDYACLKLAGVRKKNKFKKYIEAILNNNDQGGFMNTKVISAFPACGKTYMFENNKDLKMLDSDSSEFSWVKDDNGDNTKERNPLFPQNYIDHINDNLGKVDIIFVSSHDVVRKALEGNTIYYTLVYPDISLKDEWIQRFIDRDNNEGFINFISSNWSKFIESIENEMFPDIKKLNKGEYISDIL